MRDFDPKQHIIGVSDQRINISISQNMQTSLTVLQMPFQELAVWLDTTVTENPFLEWQEEPERTGFSYDPSRQDVAESLSLYTHLMRQLPASLPDPALLPIAEWIVGNLDRSGFFTESFEEIPFPCKKEDFLFCLSIVQQLDPPGVGAENLRHSLLLQLRARGIDSPLLTAVLSGTSGSPDDISLLRKLLASVPDIDPFPGHRFLQNPVTLPPPDVVVTLENPSLPISICSPPFPKIVPMPEGPLSSEDKAFCRRYRSKAEHVLFWLRKRNETLEKVARYLTDKQRLFLLGETEAPFSLSIKTAAQDLQLHPSTIHRTVAGKMLCRGNTTISLKSLFPRKLSEEVSAEQAKTLLRKLIAEESKTDPLSDEKLLEKMQQFGIPCARRTLAKYRKLLKIPPGHLRKISKKL